MRLNPTVLSILAGTIAGAALTGCGGASQTTETSTQRTEAESIEVPTTVSTTSTTTGASTLPATNGPQPEDLYAVDCGRG
jgi:hypothetical protein